MTKRYILMGRSFAVAAEFPDTEDGMRAANAHMEANRSLGVLDVAGGRIILASLADKGIPLRNLKCSCCGGEAGRFVQWHNRDTGYGICSRCVTWILKDRAGDPEEFRRNYGEPGIHYAAESADDTNQERTSP